MARLRLQQRNDLLDAAVIHLVLARRAGGFAVPTPQGPDISIDRDRGVITVWNTPAKGEGAFAYQTPEQAKAELDARFRAFGKRVGEVVWSDRIYQPLGRIA